jgi:N-acetylmuramoyl-L-alanine amidase
MIIFLRKRTLTGIGMAAVVLLSCFSLRGMPPGVVASFAPGENASMVVVIDPGHGGEDGGAVSSAGAEESRINLEIALRLNQLLRFCGTRTLMTRVDDSSIGDPELAPVRERKVSDLKNRVKIVNDTENAVLLSIHQNSLPSSPVTHGAQAFWNHHPGADVLA